MNAVADLQPSWSLSEVAQMTGGRLESASGEATDRRFEYQAISLDTRTISPGDFFVALRGERHDAHKFLEQAALAGAIGALVERVVHRPSFPQVVVEDTLAGWQSWGSAHRRAWSNRPLVGLTGSSGKTTTKDLLAHLLRGVGPVWATEGNRNNHVGVPWTLLGLSPAHSFGVVEMGMNHPGEIAQLSRITAPTVAVLTGVGSAHIGHLGSKEAVLAAKLEILEGLAPKGPIVWPSDPWVLERLPESERRRPRQTFGLEMNADWHPVGPIEWSLRGTRFATNRTGPVQLSLLGPGALLSALAALATVEALGLPAADLATRLSSAPRRPLRMEPRQALGVSWLLDCYNASPESTHLALEFLEHLEPAGRRVLVLGELGELGSASETIHRELGERAGIADLALFIGAGAKAAWAACPTASPQTHAWVERPEEATDWLRSQLQPGDLVLLKGSRRVALERLLPWLEAEPGEPHRVGG